MKIKSLLRKRLRRLVLWGKKRAYKEVLVLGDSHAKVFTAKRFKSAFPYHFFNIIKVAGATVSGLQNPNSKTQALPKFMDNLKKSTARTTIVLLGEVDVGFVIWYRAEKFKTPVDPNLEEAIVNYQKLLRTIAEKSHVICLSAPLPTIQDGQDWGEIANARKSIQSTQLQRTELTIQFNKRMQDFCETNGFIYLSFDDESLGENGLVNQYLINSEPNDHHYDTEKYADMIINKLKTSLVPFCF